MALDDVSITSLTFGKEFTSAIEAKQVAAQEAERAKYIVEKAEQDKRSAIIRAQVRRNILPMFACFSVGGIFISIIFITFNEIQEMILFTKVGNCILYSFFWQHIHWLIMIIPFFFFNLDQGEATSAQLIGQAIANNPAFITLRKIEAAREIAQTIAHSSNKVFLNSDDLLLNLQEMKLQSAKK